MPSLAGPSHVGEIRKRLGTQPAFRSQLGGRNPETLLGSPRRGSRSPALPLAASAPWAAARTLHTVPRLGAGRPSVRFPLPFIIYYHLKGPRPENFRPSVAAFQLPSTSSHRGRP